MAEGMNRADALAFVERWKRVQLRERQELRRMDMTEKLRKLAALMASVADLEWEGPLREEDAAVRARWNRLRKLSVE